MVLAQIAQGARLGTSAHSLCPLTMGLLSPWATLGRPLLAVKRLATRSLSSPFNLHNRHSPVGPPPSLAAPRSG